MTWPGRGEPSRARWPYRDPVGTVLLVHLALSVRHCPAPFGSSFGGAPLIRDGFFPPHGGYRLVGFLLFFVWMLLAATSMLVPSTKEQTAVAVPTTA